MAPSIRVGVVGYGISAQVFHIPFITSIPGYELVSVLQRSGHTAAERHSGIRTVRTIEEMTTDPNVDLVIVTTPNDTHFPYASAALKAGKHVVLEKPFTNTPAEARELIAIAGASGKVLSVYHNRRYVSDFLTIREILDRGDLGQVHEYVAHYDRYRPEAREHAWREAPKPGSGILYDLGPHLIDQALALFGLPQAITADVRSQRPHAQVDDFFNIWLDFGFTRAVLHSGMLVREMGPRYMVHGTLGSFIKYGEDPQEALLREGAIPVGENWGMEPPEFAGILHTVANGKPERRTIASRRGDFGDYYRNLYKTITQNAPLGERPEDGYNTVRLVELAFESNRQKRTIACTGLLS